MAKPKVIPTPAPAPKKNGAAKLSVAKSVIPVQATPASTPKPVVAGPLGLAPLSHHHWTRWTYLLLAAIAAVALGFGIFSFVHFGGSGETTVSNTNTVTNTAVALPFAPDLSGGNRNEYGHFFPQAVMIDNHSSARPQSGLQAASVVYEALVEGGITRFMAVFDKGEVAQIGPVRSARPYYLQWLAEYEAAYAHAGGSPEALTNIQKDRVHDINGIGNAATAFARDKSRPAPHNLYTTGLKLFGITEKLGLKYSDAEITPWAFGTTLATGATVKSFTMNFAGAAKAAEVSYAYDATTQRWLRSQGGQAHKDRLTNAQIRVTNVVVQRISSNITVGEKGRLGMTVTGTGSAKIFQHGQVLDATWSKPDAESRTVFTLADGTSVTFLPGNTWVEVLPTNRTLTVQ